jgi:hypothetical protein
MRRSTYPLSQKNKPPNQTLSTEAGELHYELSGWMRDRLLLACWAAPRDFAEPLIGIEERILARLQPPLNLAKVATPWKPVVDSARRVMAAEARACRP